MNIERALQFSMATLVTLGTLVLGMGEDSFVIPILGTVAAWSAVYLTDIRGWLRLNNAMSNVAGAATVVLCLWELRRVGAESQALALANLLFYLQCVLMFRPKEPRVYWMIALLSLLQVAVASALNDDMLFGFFLALYYLTGLVTLTLFLLHREAAEAARHAVQGPIFASPTAAQSPASRLAGPAAPAPRLAAAGGRLLLRTLLGMALLSMLLTAAVFPAVPRVTQERWNQPIDNSRNSVGFNERGVSLGEMGDVIEDAGEVLRVRYLDPSTGEQVVLSEAPLLRGMLLTRYVREDASHSKWLPDPLGERVLLENLTGASTRRMVEQEITIEPLDTDTLFAVYPFYKLQAGDELYFDPNQERLFRTRRALRGRLTYRLVTPALVGGRAADVTRAANRVSLELEQLTPDQRQAMPGLAQLAAETVGKLPVDDTLGRARALERLLRDSGRFTYSLAPPPADPNLDPIEDFVTRRRAGHCEYFASALALMLRSQGIPSRIVVGFRGGELNPLGRFYQVRQHHAHTWVEAFLKPSEVPPDAPSVTRASGGWLRLDPTPSTDEVEALADAGDRWPTPREVWDYTKFLWSSYVVGLNAAKQQEQIYRPLAMAVVNAAKSLFDRDSWREFGSDVRAFLSGQGADRLLRWFNWRAGLFTIIFLGLGAVVLRFIARPLARRFGWRRAERAALTGRRPIEIAFYRRLESLLARRDWVRPPHHTQREFALAVGGQLADHAVTNVAAALPRVVTEAFYRVRFGGRTLDNREVESVEHALDSLEQAMSADTERSGDTNGGV